jgi:hypothetical protein
MADTVIRSFLVGLGFKIDEPGLRRFNEQIVKTHHAVRDFSLAFAGFAIGIEEAIRRTARQFENLFYLSQQTGISVKNLQTLGFAFGQIGLSADQMKQTVASFTSALLDSQGLRAFVNQYVPGFRNAEDALKGFAAQYKAIIDQYGVMSAKGDQFRDVLRAAHLDPDLVLQYARGLEDATKWEQRLAEALYKLGLNSDEIAEKAKDAMNEWRFTWELLGKSIDRIIGDTFPAFRRLLEDFNTWLLKGETVQSFNDIADSIHNWLQDEKNIKAVEDDLIAVGQAAAYIAKGILELIKGFVWLSDNVGPIQAILITFFGYVVAKAALAQGAILAMNAAIWGTGASLRGVAAIAAGLGGIAAFIWGMSPSTANAGEDEAIKKGLRPPSSQAEADRQRQQQLDRPKERTFWDMWTDWVHKNFPKSPTGGPDTVEGGKPPIPGARKSSFGDSEGGPASITEALFNMFGAWFKGDTAFRPIVVLADEYYTKLVDALRDLLGLGGGHGGGGAGGGVATGSGGPHQAGGRFGGMAGGGTGTSGGKGGGGATAGVSLGQMKKLAMDAGFTEEEATIGAAIWMHESSGNPRAIGKYAGELGITQINPQAHGQALANEAFGNPKRAIEIARKLYVDSVKAGHEGFRPWSSYTHGYYKQYLDAARAAKPEEYNPQMRGAGGGGDARVGGVREALVNTVNAASKFLPPGHRMHITSGFREGDSGQHGRGNALDIQIEGPNGPIANRGEDPTGVYHDFAKNWFRQVKKMYPDLTDAAAWGGEFGTEKGGGGPRDLMHLDFGGRRGRYRDDSWREGRTNNIDSEHNVTINVHGSSDPQGTARSVADLQDRRSMIHSRNLRTSIA